MLNASSRQITLIELVYNHAKSKFIRSNKIITSKDLAREAISFAPKSTPTEQAIPATKAAKTEAYLNERYY